jgi:hypothetical protein
LIKPDGCQSTDNFGEEWLPVGVAVFNYEEIKFTNWLLHARSQLRISKK